MPPNTVYVGRPTKWGNPYRLGWNKGDIGSAMLKYDTLEQVIEAYRNYIIFRTTKFIPSLKILDLTELRGRNLACWCRIDQPCHADVLLEMANK